GKDAASLSPVQAILRTAPELNTNHLRLAGVLGILTLIFGASGVFVQLQQSLNRIWGVAAKPGAALTKLLRKRLLSFAVVLGIGFLLTVSLIMSTALTALGSYLERRYHLPVTLLHALNILVSFLLITPALRLHLPPAARREAQLARRLPGRGGDLGPLRRRQDADRLLSRAHRRRL